MHILVTRPQTEARRTATRLAALGHQILYAPMLESAATDATLPERRFDAVLATSARAIATLSEPVLHALRGQPLFVVGERTAAAARAAGFTDVRPPAPDARRLALAIAAAYCCPASFLYLAGRDRKPDLEAALGKSNHRINTIIVYAAHAATALPRNVYDAWRRGEIDAVLHYSQRSAAIFRHLAEAAGLNGTQALHVCISADAAVPLQGWAPRLEIATQPSETALLSALTASPGTRP